jgi:hypothetical protein
LIRGSAVGTCLLIACAPPIAAQRAEAETRVAGAHPWLPPLASFVVPGAGQLLLKRDRGLVYLATEAFVLSKYLRLTQDARRGAGRYRDLAFTVARRGFTMARRDTVFEYYETMERFTASGEFDRNIGGVFTPEDDPTTYNGSVWLLARRTFWVDPNQPPPPGSALYLKALKFYTDHAVGPDFRWSWRDAPLEQQEFRATIRASDTGFRRAQNQLGLLLANHVVSAIDALISTRLSAGLHRPAMVRTTWLGRGGAAVQVGIGS